MLTSKKSATRLLLGVVIGLILLKGAVSWITGSMSILAQVVDSLFDLIGAIITFMAVRIAGKKADAEHPYGHDKLEDFAGLSQGILILIAGAGIIYASVVQIMAGAEIQLSEAGIAVMLVSIIASILLWRYLRRVAHMTNSAAIEASASNIKADIYSALAVLLGLILLRVSGWSIIDPIIAIGVALYILKISYDTIRKPFLKLIDTKMPGEKEEFIIEIVMQHEHDVLGYHHLRTRQAGDKYYIDLHVVMRKDISLETSHAICDKIEIEIRRGLPGSNILIHAEPCSENCRDCAAICAERKVKKSP